MKKFLLGAAAGTGLMVLLAPPVRADGFALEFENRTCGPIVLSATGNDSCFGYGGCTLDIGERSAQRVALRQGVRPRWASVSVTGQCNAGAKTEINGSCAIDLTEVFRPAGYRPAAPGRQGADFGAGGLSDEPIFEEIVGPFDPGVSFATIVVDLGICDADDGGGEVCEVHCQVR